MRDEEHYAEVRDPEAQRTRYELWAIVAIVVVIIVGGLIWRAVRHVPAKPQQGWASNSEQYPGGVQAAPAAAGVSSHGAAAPP
jgi:hypothetical protein